VIDAQTQRNTLPLVAVTCKPDGEPDGELTLSMTDNF